MINYDNNNYKIFQCDALSTLINYLNDNFNQDYFNKYDDIKSFLIKAEQETEKIIYSKSKNTFQPNKKK